MAYTYIHIPAHMQNYRRLQSKRRIQPRKIANWVASKHKFEYLIPHSQPKRWQKFLDFIKFHRHDTYSRRAKDDNDGWRGKCLAHLPRAESMGILLARLTIIALTATKIRKISHLYSTKCTHIHMYVRSCTHTHAHIWTGASFCFGDIKFS